MNNYLIAELARLHRQELIADAERHRRLAAARLTPRPRRPHQPRQSDQPGQRPAVLTPVHVPQA